MKLFFKVYIDAFKTKFKKLLMCTLIHIDEKNEKNKLLTGLEPATSALRGRHTTNCVTVAQIIYLI